MTDKVRAPIRVPYCVGWCKQAGTEGHEYCILIDWNDAIIRTIEPECIGRCRHEKCEAKRLERKEWLRGIGM